MARHRFISSSTCAQVPIAPSFSAVRSLSLAHPAFRLRSQAELETVVAEVERVPRVAAWRDDVLRIARAVSYPSRTVSFELPVPTHLCGGRETERGHS